jgi:asparagine synthase (glutamine-hydrolysing)
MCGIAGYVTQTPSSDPESILTRMIDVIRHRGPDGEGVYRDQFAALGHRRLSIIDVAGGSQPMATADRALWVIYNGEVFNHADLRGNLERAGHQYRTRCDTETILHAYREHGAASVTLLRGMFAYAIWDKDRRTLFCARDRLGIKPFYYYWDGRLFAFASEIKALLVHPAISPRFEESLLPEYLALGYSSDDRTLFSGIRKLMPGHHLTLGPAGGPRIERYWDVPAPQSEGRRSDEDWIAECRRRLEETVRMRLMSDVPLGMFLSGGVDSSAIAALMKRIAPGPVKSFAVGYQEAEYSELGYAAEVSRAIGTEHKEVVVSRKDFFDALPKLIWHEDEPIVWPSSVSLYFVSRLAAQDVKVVLTGEGSDEMFAGYSRYRLALLNQRLGKIYGGLPGPARGWIASQISDSSLLSGALRRKLGHTVLGRGTDVESLYVDNWFSAFSRAEQSRLLRAPNGSHTYDSFLRFWNAGAGSPLSRMLYADLKTYLVELLMKQDQMSMATSIESRVPFLDHPFVEFSTRVPDDLKIRGGAGKYILKRAVEDLLPHDIIYRKKMGFSTPLREWLSDRDAAPMLAGLLDPDCFLAAYLDRPALTTLLGQHQSGRIDATDRIWRLLNLQIWGETFITSKIST